MRDRDSPDWLAQALDRIPELELVLAEELEGDVEHSLDSPFPLWFELLPMTRQAHRAVMTATDKPEREHSRDLLRRIYGYAAWSMSHPERQVWNAVGVGFYEHLFDERWMRPLVVRWLNDRVIADAYALWEARLDNAAMKEIDNLLRAERRLPAAGRARASRHSNRSAQQR